MNAGTLRTRIELQQPTTPVDADWGASGPTFATAVIVHAEVSPQRAAEQPQGQQIQASTRYTIRIRYRPEVLATWRILLSSGTALDIIGIVDTDMRHRELVIDAVEHTEAA